MIQNKFFTIFSGSKQLRKDTSFSQRLQFRLVLFLTDKISPKRVLKLQKQAIWERQHDVSTKCLACQLLSATTFVKSHTLQQQHNLSSYGIGLTITQEFPPHAVSHHVRKKCRLIQEVNVSYVYVVPLFLHQIKHFFSSSSS